MKFIRKRLKKTADISRGKTSWQAFLKNALSVVIIFTLGYLALGALAFFVSRGWAMPLFAGRHHLTSRHVKNLTNPRSNKVKGMPLGLEPILSLHCLASSIETRLHKLTITQDPFVAFKYKR